MTTRLRILVVAEHASARFGGEAALALHHYRVHKARGTPVWLVSHARTRAELAALHPGDDHIHYVEDTRWHRFLWRLAHWLPPRIDYVTTGFMMRLATQRTARRRVRALVREHAIDVVHQPMPVSPREPSRMHDVGAPVVIGPMNGGMSYPPAFAPSRGVLERLVVAAGRRVAGVLNALWPGKRRAAALLVANARTRDALPVRHPRVIELVENGVDLGLWRPAAAAADIAPGSCRFVFMGRLVDWKAVDIALEALARARGGRSLHLDVVGDGDQRPRLEALARSLGLDDIVAFAGWLPQAECARHLAAADALLLPSLFECGGAVVLEAMAAGKPVVATAWGGPLDYLDASCGILVAPTSRDALVEGFAGAIAALADDPPLRRSLGLRGRAKAISEYDWDAKGERMLEIFAAVVAPY